MTTSDYQNLFALIPYILLHYILPLILLQTVIFYLIGLKSQERLQAILHFILQRYQMMIPMSFVFLIIFASHSTLSIVSNLFITISLILTPYISALIAQSAARLRR